MPWYAQLARGVFGDEVCQFKSFGQEVCLRYDIFAQTLGVRFGSGIKAACQHHFARLPPAHAAHQKMRRGQFRHDAHFDKDQSEFCFLGGDDNVEGQNHGDADADGDTIDCRNQWF